MIDFGKTASDYARYRAPFAPQLFDRMGVLGIGLPGQQILDVASGTGLLAQRFIARGCTAICLDCSTELLGQIPGKVTCIAANAEALPFADDGFDVVTAAQCWHWFDRNLAPREMLRVLRPGGHIAVIYQTHIPFPGSVAEQTEQLILRHRPGWRHANSTGINGQVLRDLQINGFMQIECFSFDVALYFSRDNWRGYVRTLSAVGATMPNTQLMQFDQEHHAMLRDFPEILEVPHRIFAAVAQKGD